MPASDCSSRDSVRPSSVLFVQRRVALLDQPNLQRPPGCWRTIHYRVDSSRTGAYGRIPLLVAGHPVPEGVASPDVHGVPVARSGRGLGENVDARDVVPAVLRVVDAEVRCEPVTRGFWHFGKLPIFSSTSRARGATGGSPPTASSARNPSSSSARLPIRPDCITHLGDPPTSISVE